VNPPAARLTVKVIPGASRSELAGFAGGVLRVRVAAAPERDKANRELMVFLAGALGIRKSAVAMVGGRTGRTKILEIAGLTEAEVRAKLGLPEALP
jgi:uncharacterized protein YggU (UPF0235/DUF167 family)